MTDYVVHHKDCGHVAYIGNYRQGAEQAISMLAATHRWGWRIRAGASDADIKSLLREDRCDVCAVKP